MVAPRHKGFTVMTRTNSPNINGPFVQAIVTF